MSLSLSFGLSLMFWGCPDQVRVVDLGVPVGGEGAVEAGVSAGVEVVDEGCSVDVDCERGAYCEFDEATLQGRCVEGCRSEPDTCAVGGSQKRCDPETRACVLPCQDDSGCFEGEYCGEEGVCVEGCRLNDPHACPSSELGPGFCDPNTRTCGVGAVCCDLNDACSIDSAERCFAVGGEALEGLLSCEPNPCGALCNLDGLCAESEYCSEYGRCMTGCRVGEPEGCPSGLACHPERRRCEVLSCESDEGCPAWQYCGEGECRDGCREGGCADGLRCDASHVCRDACELDADCEPGYCDQRSNTCHAPCDEGTHQGCAPDEACVEGRCEVGCADDPFELEGDDEAVSAPVVSWVEGELTSARSTGLQQRVLCLEDQDWLTIPLVAGERLEVRASGRPSSGDLTLSLYAPSGELLMSSVEPWAERQRLTYPPLGQGVSVGGDYQLKVSSSTPLEDHPYTLSVRAAPLAEACFSDPFDPSDDALRGARSLGLTPALRFTELAEGDLCFGDVDLLCFPMSASDGLSLIVDTPASCDPLSVRLSSSERVEAVLGEGFDEALDYELSGSQGAGQWSAEGGSRYELRLDAERGAFTNDLWCASLRAVGELGCEGYALSASFTRGQLVCSDVREPNNVLSQATELDGAGPLAAAGGQVPYDLNMTLSDPLYLCSGERDLFKVQARAGDAWRAWLINDSDSASQGNNAERGELSGGLTLRFLNDQGQRVGDSATLNEGDAQSQIATAVVSADTALYLQVDGVLVNGLAESEGPYKLALRRVAPTGPCSQDVNEPVGRDDELSPASSLRQEVPHRYSVNNGLLCEPNGGADEDWYAFELTQNSTRLCLNSAFRHSSGNIDVELFELGDPTQGQPCATHADCRNTQAGSSCVQQRCRAPLARATSLNDGELINIPSAESSVGQYFARVYSPEGASNAYQLSVSLAPPSSTCLPDFHELEGSNDRPQDATPLGSGYVRLCDTWLCETERVDGDWFEVVVPAGAHRTLHVSFESQQGRLTLSAEDASSLAGNIVESPRSPSRNAHCINVIGGPRPATLKVQVAADTLGVGQRRVDYQLSVAPVNLNANPRGACDNLNGGLFSEVTWPTLDLRSP